MVQRVKYAFRDAWLGKEFGESYARKVFGDEVVDALPRYVKGKNVGKIKAEINWIKVEEGGWTGHNVDNRVGQVIAHRIVAKDFRTGKIEEVYAEKGDTVLFASVD